MKQVVATCVYLLCTGNGLICECVSFYQSPSDFPVSTMDAIAEEPSGEDTTSNEGSEHNVAEPHDSSDNIKLQRVTGVSFRHTKAPPASILKEGWMVHYTNKSDMVSRLSRWSRDHYVMIM